MLGKRLSVEFPVELPALVSGDAAVSIVLWKCLVVFGGRWSLQHSNSKNDAQDGETAQNHGQCCTADRPLTNNTKFGKKTCSSLEEQDLTRRSE